MPYKHMIATVFAFVLAGGTWLLAQGGPLPSFGQLTATPAGYLPTTATAVPNIVVNTATVITFRIEIATPTLNPTTVQLQRVTSSGTLISAAWRMYDDGTHGDLVAGDKVFAADITSVQQAVGRIYFRVAAAFRGNAANAWSQSIPIDVDPVKLPPDPGDAGKLTVPGTDSDHDGVRDDVQRYIVISYPDPGTQGAVTQDARLLQAFLAVQTTQDAVSSFILQTKAATCLDYLRPNDGSSLRRALEAATINTDQRGKAYLHVNSLLSGQSFDLFPLTDQQKACSHD
jgi:hypothetical protein